MKNKGFTLIELLAVIVILAIIALIATPIVLGIIEDSRDSASENSAQFIIDGVQTAYAVAYTKSYEDKASGMVPSIAHIKEEIDFKNATATIKADGALEITSGDIKCTFAVGEKNVLTSDDCTLEGKIEPTKIGEVSVEGTTTGGTETTQTQPTS